MELYVYMYCDANKHAVQWARIDTFLVAKRLPAMPENDKHAYAHSFNDALLF